MYTDRMAGHGLVWLTVTGMTLYQKAWIGDYFYLVTSCKVFKRYPLVYIRRKTRWLCKPFARNKRGISYQPQQKLT